MEKCPCGSGLSYQDCCQAVISGAKDAPTAEALMRARYTSYVKGEIGFIESTHNLGESQPDEVSTEVTREWSQESTWLGLKILGREKGGVNDDWGKVEFVASYVSKGLHEDYHEIGEFKKSAGKWYYDKGTIVPTQITRQQPKVGRNDPCPCGSGKKYKLCHGR